MIPSLTYILQNFEAVIFDMDGTMVDSMWVWEEIDHDFFRNRGMAFPENLHKEIEGMSFSETAEYFVKTYQMEETVEQVKEIWNQMALEKYRTVTPLKPGVKEFLKILKDHGIKTGIATSNSRLLADTFLQSRNLEGQIDAITTACDVKRGKPSPDVYFTTAEKLQVKPEKCFVFEDVPMGILAGKNAGMTVCGIEDEYSSDLAEEKKKLSDYYITDFSDILTEELIV